MTNAPLLQGYSLRRPNTRFIVWLYMQHVNVQPKAPRKKRTATRLTPNQLRRLADLMVGAKDPAEVARLKKELERGFYGDPAHA
jgi:hypothetical protein